MKGQVKNHSSQKLWVLVSKGNQMYAYQLAPGYQSPSNIDADGFCAVFSLRKYKMSDKKAIGNFCFPSWYEAMSKK